MAKAAGRSALVAVKTAARDSAEFMELAARLADLARAQEEARGAVGENDPNYAAAFGRLFIAVALLNPRHAEEAIRTLAEPSVP